MVRDKVAGSLYFKKFFNNDVFSGGKYEVWGK